MWGGDVVLADAWCLERGVDGYLRAFGQQGTFNMIVLGSDRIVEWNGMHVFSER